MNTLMALLAGIRESPEDDAPRLVLADWLEEFGQTEADRSRAELIRVQCLAAGQTRDDPRRRQAEQRAEQLLQQHRRAWCGPFRDDESVIFRRGLLEVDFYDDGEPSAELLADEAAWAWVESSAFFTDQWGEGQLRFLASDRLRWLTRFGLGPNTCPAEAARLLVTSGHTSSLRDLWISGATFAADDLRALLASPHLGALERLSLRGAWRQQPPWRAALADARLPPRLTELTLDEGMLGEDGLLALARSPYLGQLTKLDLQGNGMDAVAARALAQSPSLRRPLDLSVRGNPLGDEGLIAVLNGRLLPHAIPSVGVAARAVSPFVAGLENLDLANTQTGDEGAQALAASPHLGRLRCLVLRDSGVGISGVVALVSGKLTALRQLYLDHNTGLANGAGAVLEALTLPALESLDLGWVRLGDEEAQRMAQAPALARLRELDLEGNSISDAGALALAGSPYLDRLERLVLEDNQITEDGGRVLRERLGERVRL
jgi:uncharacterized protein (TIGR02996 family)